MEVRTYKSDTDLKRAWKQLRNSGRTVKLHEHKELSLLVGPVTSDKVWSHKTYRSSDLVTRALQGYKRHGKTVAEKCDDHELCVRTTSADAIIAAHSILDKLEQKFAVETEVKITRGKFKNLTGKVILKMPGGIVQVNVPLASKPVIIEMPETALRLVTDEDRHERREFEQRMNEVCGRAGRPPKKW